MIKIKDIVIPSSLKGEGLKHYKKIITSNGNISEKDLPLVKLASEVYQELTDASKHLADEGSVIIARNGYSQLNPYYKIKHNASNRLIALYIQLKMTPLSRKQEEEPLPELEF